MAASLRLACLALCGLVLAACQATPVPAGAVHLVRHAEKTTDTPDPGLTPDGVARAEALADRLQGAGITAVWSTDYARTRETAAPLAVRLGLEVQLYDPRDLPGFAAQLKAAPDERVLVVGHSNTTPDLVSALGGEPGSPIDEASEYDRLYIVSLVDGATELQRYGVAYHGGGGDE